MRYISGGVARLSSPPKAPNHFFWEMGIASMERQEGVEGSGRAADALGNVGQLGHEYLSSRPDNPALQAILILKTLP